MASRSIHDALPLDGVLRLYERPAGDEGEWRHVLDAPNIVVNAFYNALFGVMSGVSTTSLLVGALSLGTGVLPTAGVSRTDTQMVREWMRYPIASVLPNTADPSSVVISFFSPSRDGAQTLTEAGLWIAGATTVLGSGTLATHAIFSYSKSSLNDLRIDYTLTRSLT